MQSDPDSPFSATPSSSFVLYIEPVLNQYYQTYQNVITVSCCPSGPIAEMVVPIRAVKLSPFQENGRFSESAHDSCMFVLSRYKKGSQKACIKNTRFFMTAEDIPSVISYLTENGYAINSDITRLLFKSGIALSDDNRHSQGKRKMICLVSYAAAAV
jgi:hypothetical protein